MFLAVARYYQKPWIRLTRRTRSDLAGRSLAKDIAVKPWRQTGAVPLLAGLLETIDSGTVSSTAFPTMELITRAGGWQIGKFSHAQPSAVKLGRA